MKKKKIETLGQLLQHLVDDEEGKQVRKGENGKDEYPYWVCKELDELLMDEGNPQITFEVIGSESVLGMIFHPLRKISDQLCNGCGPCMQRMKDAYQAKVKNNKK